MTAPTDNAALRAALDELAEAFEQPGSITHTTGPKSDVAAILRSAAALAAAIPPEQDGYAQGRAREVPAGYKLPCDVHLPPATVVRAGCDLSTLKLAMEAEYRPRHFEGNPRTSLHTPTDRHAEGRIAGLEEAATAFEKAISEGYLTPANKTDQCEHGKFGWEDCIACYDDALYAAAIRLRTIANGGTAA
jgi:hypothetical protein